MKKFLTTLAGLTAIATPALAQSFDPESGTGNVLPFSNAPTAPRNDKIAVDRSGPRLFRHGPELALDVQSGQSGNHWRWQRSAIMKCSVTIELS